MPLAVLQRQRAQNGTQKEIVIPPQKLRDVEMDAHEVGEGYAVVNVVL